MSTVTTYYNLVKPAPLEAFSRATYNTNLDLIDAAIRNETIKIKHTEYTRLGQNDAPANTPWGPGQFGTAPLNVDAGPTKNASWFLGGIGNDQWRVTEEGVYSFSWNLKNVSGFSHGFWLRLSDTAGTLWYGEAPTRTVANNEFITLSIANIYLAANTTLQVRYSCSGVNQAVDHKFKFSKVLG